VNKVSRKKKVSIHKVLENQERNENELTPSQEMPSKGIRQKTTSIITLIQILILLFISFTVYFNALSGDFVYDDIDQVVNNPWIRDIRNIQTIFSKSVLSFRPGLSTSNYYRPLMHIMYMVNYHVFGLKPWGFHLVNILFHSGASVLVFLIIRRLLIEYKAATYMVYLSPSFIAALLFATHPIHTEAVTSIAGLPDLASTLFYLLSFYLYMLFRDGAKKCYLGSILSFSVAILFKEPALTLLIILIIYDYVLKPLDETLFTRIKRYLPYAVASGVYLLLRYYALGSFAPNKFYAGLNTYQSIINIFPLFREYLTSLLWPFKLNYWPTFHPIRSIGEAKFIISIVVTVIFFIAAAAANRKNKVLFLSFLFLVIPLLPVFYIKGISGKPFAERYLYLPSFGFVLLLATFLSWTRERLQQRAVTAITISFMVVVGFYSVGTIRRNNVWMDNFHFWLDIVKKSPDLVEAHNNLGIAYAAQGQWDKAIAEYETALRLRPEYLVAHNNLGVAYAAQGQWDKAIAEYETALRLRPNTEDAHYNLGIAYASQGQWDKAIAEYETALRLRPDNEDAHYNLGIAYAAQGQWDKAITEYQTALRLRPDFYEARQRLNDVASRRH
jgi:tetratricopeptide (TPR) repeat protein